MEQTVKAEEVAQDKVPAIPKRMHVSDAEIAELRNKIQNGKGQYANREQFVKLFEPQFLSYYPEDKETQHRYRIYPVKGRSPFDGKMFEKYVVTIEILNELYGVMEKLAQQLKLAEGYQPPPPLKMGEIIQSDNKHRAIASSPSEQGGYYVRLHYSFSRASWVGLSDIDYGRKGLIGVVNDVPGPSQSLKVVRTTQKMNIVFLEIA